VELGELAKQHLGKMHSNQFEGVQTQGWVFIGSIPLFCKKCAEPFVLFANINSSEYSSGTLFGCGNCKSITKGIDLSLAEKRFLSEYWTAAKGRFEHIGKVNTNVAKVQESVSQQASGINFPEENEVNEYLRNGLRIVCWLKKEEARAILEAYEVESSIRGRDSYGQEFSIMWFESDDSALDKFNTSANVLLVRHRKNGERRIGWIYDFEAQFALDSMENRKTYDLEISDEVKGAVVFFENASTECQKYKANVCLLRKRGYRY
jgi:hypothetical protein